MIYEIKIEVKPKYTITKLLPIIKFLEAACNTIGFKFTINRYAQNYSAKELINDEFVVSVCDEVGKYFSKEIDPKDLFKVTRKPEIVTCRYLIMKRDIKSSISYANAAGRFDMDHSTVNHAKKSISDSYETDRRYRELIHNIERRTNIKLV